MHRDLDDEEEEEGPDDFDDDGYDPEEPETYPQGLYADDGPATVPCPHCRTEILEDNERCPNCGMYLSKEDAYGKSRSGWWMIVAVLALIATMLLMIG
jgi:predicted nucleic acid-binding Zn ribbon protein